MGGGKNTGVGCHSLRQEIFPTLGSNPVLPHCRQTLYSLSHQEVLGFPGGSESKVSACGVGDLGSIPGSEDLLEKGMATHSSILAWRIPSTEEPGGLQYTGSQRVGQD